MRGSSRVSEFVEIPADELTYGATFEMPAGPMDLFVIPDGVPLDEMRARVESMAAALERTLTPVREFVVAEFLQMANTYSEPGVIDREQFQARVRDPDHVDFVGRDRVIYSFDDDGMLGGLWMLVTVSSDGEMQASTA